MSGKSVVNIEVKREINANLPAITICYPEIISMESAANESDILRDLYLKYEQMIDNSKWNNTLYETYKEKMTNLYWGFKQHIPFKTYDEYIKKVMTNMSLPFKYGQFQYGYKNGTLYQIYKNIPIIHIQLTGNFDKHGQNYNILEKIEYTNSSFIHKDNPIETVNFQHNAKCFTFFSFLNLDWIDIKLDLDLIQIWIYNNNNWFPPHMLTKFYLAIHSPKIIPELRMGLEFVEILPNADYYASFSKINVDRYYSETNSNCKDYNIKKYHKLRSDCIATCILKKLGENVAYYTQSISSLLRIDHFNDIEKPTYNYTNYYSYNRITDITQECHRIFKQNCKYSYYLYDISMIRKFYEFTNEHDKMATVTLQHNRLPDLFVRHIPETTFISFVGNFGGLLGMWLGVNAWIMFDTFYMLTHKIIKAIGKKDIQQNKIFIQRNNYYNLRNTNLTQNINLF